MKKNINTRIFSLTILSVVAAVAVHAQDPHFSQYFTSPLTINPSYTGKDVVDYRMSLNARTQWWGSHINPYNTYTISLEKRIAADKTGDDQLAVGAVLLTDGSNDGVLKNTYAGLSVAFNKALDEGGRTRLGVGLSAHYANRILDPTKFQFQSQFGSMGFQRDMPSNDYIVVEKNSYVDVNAGVNFSQTLDSWGYNLGVGYFHAARPKEGVYNTNQYYVDPRTSVQGSVWFAVGQGSNKSRVYLSSISEFQGGNSIYTLGCVYKVKIGGDDTLESFDVGVFDRFRDAAYPYLALEATNWIVGLTYDAVTSEVRNYYNSVSSMELSFVWQFSTKKTAPKPTGKVFNF